MATGGASWASLLLGRGGVLRLMGLQLVGFATWLPVVAWVNLNVVELATVNGPSMYPLMNADWDSTLRRDRVLNWKYLPQKGLKRGMVVTLRNPMNPKVIAVKRVVALEGDTLTTKAPYPFPQVKVPTGHVWVEGDGPPGSSLDSNTYGAVSKQLLTGRITHILWPFKSMGRIRYWEHERVLVE